VAPGESDGTAAPETSGRSVRVIIPPPDIKAIADKTAKFVARFGKPFEIKIKLRNGQTGKFQFLAPENDFHAYYLDMILKRKERLKRKAQRSQRRRKAEQPKAEQLKAGQALVLEEKQKDEEEAERNRMLMLWKRLTIS